MTFELTAGLADFASIGCMELNARRPATGLDYAGWRVLPRLYAPRSWRLPVDVGLVAEFSFQKTTYEENSRRLEVRPILEKRIGRIQVDFNPVFERALCAPGTSDGWNFEPAARLPMTPRSDSLRVWSTTAHRDRYPHFCPPGNRFTSFCRVAT
jgi:hypothetical protein